MKVYYMKLWFGEIYLSEYLVAKETKKLYKVEDENILIGRSGSYRSQLSKDDSRVYKTLREALEAALVLLSKGITLREEQVEKMIDMTIYVEAMLRSEENS